MVKKNVEFMAPIEFVALIDDHNVKMKMKMQEIASNNQKTSREELDNEIKRVIDDRKESSNAYYNS